MYEPYHVNLHTVSLCTYRSLEMLNKLWPPADAAVMAVRQRVCMNSYLLATNFKVPSYNVFLLLS